MGLAAISYDSVPVLADFSQRRGITFPLLSDSGSAVIRAYGILNTSVPSSNQQQYGIPFPGTFILSARGVVTSRVFEAAYQERNTISSIMIRLGGRMKASAATQVTAPHLQLTTFVTDETVAPGTHFSIVVEGVPEKNAHVYAPGVTGYKPLALAIDPQPGLVIRGIQLPKAEDYFFKPLNEHVPVYLRPFRVVHDLMIDGSRETEAALHDVSRMTITGSLTYQACDDKVCFLPQAVPLTWAVGLKLLDRERSRPQ
jgi:hypothetical protein